MFVTKQKFFSVALCLFLTLVSTDCPPAQEKTDNAPAEGKKKSTPSISIRGASIELAPAIMPAGEPTAATSGLSGEEQPRLTIDVPNYDAGELWEGEDIIHTFTIRNTGKGRLEITDVKPG